jgi:branched-chain amino acid aminotransferase
VIEVAQAAGYVLREELFRLEDVLTADECFLTGTGAEIAPVREVDGQEIGSGKPGPITHELHAAFQELTAREGTPVFAGVP